MHMQEADVADDFRVRLCRGSSLLSRLAAGVAMAALVLHVASVGSSYWVVGSVRDGETVLHAGLWRECVRLDLFTTREAWHCAAYDASHHIDTAPGFLKASQAFAILGVLGHVVVTSLLTLLTLLPRLTGQRPVLLVSVVASAASALFVLIAMSVYPAEYPHRHLPPFSVTWSVTWCFALDFLSMMASIAVVVMLFVDFRSRVHAFSDSSV